jgi:polyferredoxin
MKKTRRVVQGGFLALALLGVFYFRANAESWCPFGGIEALYTYVHEGNLLCSLGISNFYVLAALLASVLVVRRAFCGYLCPIGTVSEWLRIASGRLGLPGLRIPAPLDHMLSLAKYLVLAAVLVATWRAGELLFRGYCPAYALVSRHGADITCWAYVVAGAIALVSLIVTMPFCRWFCPLAAVSNPFSRLGLARIKRNLASCSECGRCAASCPMAIPVHQLRQVTSSRCLSCMNCIDACPRKQERPLSWGPPDWLGRVWPRWTVIGVLLLSAGSAVAAAYLAPLPSFVKVRGTPPARIASVELRVRELTCRGRANLLVGFLERDDMYQLPGAEPNLPGYYRLEAWPSPDVAVVRVSYDPRHSNEESIQRAITEPYFDMAENRWWMSPFVIEGYTPPGLQADSARGHRRSSLQSKDGRLVTAQLPSPAPLAIAGGGSLGRHRHKWTASGDVGQPAYGVGRRGCDAPGGKDSALGRTLVFPTARSSAASVRNSSP